MDVQAWEQAINNPDAVRRKEAREAIGSLIKEGTLTRIATEEVNNHVHTTYSFSPYEPSAAAYAAWKAGLGIVGSIDHDSISAAQELLAAGQAIGIASTVGFELRVSFLDTSLAKRKINNPDSVGIAYMCVHGVAKNQIPSVKQFLEPVHTVRNRRNKAQVEALQALVGRYGFDLDFQRDVLPLSRASEGGSVTERHILYAMALQTIQMYGKGEALVAFLSRELGLSVQGKLLSYLLDAANPHYAYDLLGLYKSAFLPRFFIQPGRDECPDVRSVVDFANSIGAIAAYAYLGDVKESVTGDKKAEEFEDGFLEELLDLLVECRFPAITYMPPRNTKAQMARLQSLATMRGLMEISGVDINSSRQSLSCPQLLESSERHLVDNAWALVAHEKASSIDPRYGLFHPENPYSMESLEKRLLRYAAWGRTMDSFHPYESMERILGEER